TLPALTVPFMATAFIIFLLRQFFVSIPNELYDAAVIDGAGHLRFLTAVVVPMSKPVLMTATLLTFVTSWNEFLWPLLVTTTPQWRPLGVGLYTFLSEAGPETHLLMAGTVITVLPVLIIYFFTQKQFTEGIATPGLKGSHRSLPRTSRHPRAYARPCTTAYRSSRGAAALRAVQAPADRRPAHILERSSAVRKEKADEKRFPCPDRAPGAAAGGPGAGTGDDGLRERRPDGPDRHLLAPAQPRPRDGAAGDRGRVQRHQRVRHHRRRRVPGRLRRHLPEDGRAARHPGHPQHRRGVPEP